MAFFLYFLNKIGETRATKIRKQLPHLTRGGTGIELGRKRKFWGSCCGLHHFLGESKNGTFHRNLKDGPTPFLLVTKKENRAQKEADLVSSHSSWGVLSGTHSLKSRSEEKELGCAWKRKAISFSGNLICSKHC